MRLTPQDMEDMKDGGGGGGGGAQGGVNSDDAQSQQVVQNQGMMGSGGNGSPRGGLSGAGALNYSIPGILHFLQHEWSRFEMERSQWEVEKAELQVRVKLKAECPLFYTSPWTQ